MPRTDERLRRISDNICLEANPPEDRRRPLEWRRSINRVSFRVGKLRAKTTHSVNELDWSLEGHEDPKHLQMLKPNVETVYSVEGVVDPDKTRDRIFCFAKTDEADVFKLERPSGQMRVLLRGGLALGNHKTIPHGVFMGNLLRMNFEPRQDYLCLDATIPEEQIRQLHMALKENPLLELDVTALVHSFSYEVEDALREDYHPRTLIVTGSAASPISQISTALDYEEPPSDKAVVDQDDWLGVSEPPAPPAPEPMTEAQAITATLIGLVSKEIALMSAATKRISLALWILIAAVLVTRLY